MTRTLEDYEMHRFTDYEIDRREWERRLVREARGSRVWWLIACLYVALVLAVQIGCESPTRVHAPLEPVTAFTPVTEARLLTARALAVGDPSPQAAEHAAWCWGTWHCICAGWSPTPRDSSRTKPPVPYTATMPPNPFGIGGWKY